MANAEEEFTAEQLALLKRRWRDEKPAVEVAEALGYPQYSVIDLFIQWDADLEEWISMYRIAKKRGAI